MADQQLLFVVVHEGDVPVIYRTEATQELLNKLSNAGGEWGAYTGFEDSKDLVLPLSMGTPIAAFTQIVGPAPLVTVPLDEMLRVMGADGLDCFY